MNGSKNVLINQSMEISKQPYASVNASQVQSLTMSFVDMGFTPMR